MWKNRHLKHQSVCIKHEIRAVIRNVPLRPQLADSAFILPSKPSSTPRTSWIRIKKINSLTALLKSVHPRYICWAVILFICKTLQGAFEIMIIIKKSLSLFLPHQGADWLFRWCPLPVKSRSDGKNICVLHLWHFRLIIVINCFFFFFLMSQSPCTSLSSVTNGLQG